MSAVTTYRAQHRAAFAVFEHASIQQIGRFEAAIQALKQKAESVSRAFPNCALTLTRAPHSKSSSPGSEFGSGLGGTAQDYFEEATSQPTSCTSPIPKVFSQPSTEGRSSASPGTGVFFSPENEHLVQQLHNVLTVPKQFSLNSNADVCVPMEQQNIAEREKDDTSVFSPAQSADGLERVPDRRANPIKVGQSTPYQRGHNNSVLFL